MNANIKFLPIFNGRSKQRNKPQISNTFALSDLDVQFQDFQFHVPASAPRSLETLLSLAINIAAMYATKLPVIGSKQDKTSRIRAKP